MRRYIAILAVICGLSAVALVPLAGASNYPIPKVCKVPNVVGKTLAKAETALTKANCSVGKITKTKSKKVAKGDVISSSPSAGKTEKLHAKVALTVSKGKK